MQMEILKNGGISVLPKEKSKSFQNSFCCTYRLNSSGLEVDMENIKEFEGKVVLITGGGKGIGKGIALEFAKKGARVAIGCNQTPGMAQDTLFELQKITDAILIQSDIEKPEGCYKLVDETITRFGKLDILVNNAALQTNHSFLMSNEEIYKKLYHINIRAAFLLMQYCHPWLKKSENGRIILISSIHGKRPTDFDAAYAISKGSMEMLCREAAIEFAADRITVNIIAPGAVAIEGKSGNQMPFPKSRKPKTKIFSRMPLGVGMPADTAYMACMLAREESSQISGASIRIDGCASLL